MALPVLFMLASVTSIHRGQSELGGSQADSRRQPGQIPGGYVATDHLIHRLDSLFKRVCVSMDRLKALLNSSGINAR